MPNGLRNWTYSDVVAVLREYGFVLHHVRGSHYYYVGTHEGKLRMTHVPYHGKNPLLPKTLSSIIKQSGIPKHIWTKKN